MGKESTMNYLVSEWVGFLVLLFVVYSPSFFAFIFNCALEFPSASQYKHIHTYIHIYAHTEIKSYIITTSVFVARYLLS